MQIQSRLTYILMFVVVAGLLLFSLYLQFYQHFQPCPLCSLQRLAFVLIGLFVFLTIILYPFRICRLVFNFLSLASAILGMLLAGRQIWLQHFPPQTTECSPSLQYMFQVLPMNELIQKIFTGSAECVEKVWQFLGLTMAEWTMIWFIGFSALLYYLLRADLIRKQRRRR